MESWVFTAIFTAKNADQSISTNQFLSIKSSQSTVGRIVHKFRGNCEKLTAKTMFTVTQLNNFQYVKF